MKKALISVLSVSGFVLGASFHSASACDLAREYREGRPEAAAVGADAPSSRVNPIASGSEALVAGKDVTDAVSIIMQYQHELTHFEAKPEPHPSDAKAWRISASFSNPDLHLWSILASDDIVPISPELYKKKISGKVDNDCR